MTPLPSADCYVPSMCTDESVEGRLGPQPVVLDHTSGFEGLLFVDDDLLGVRVAAGTAPHHQQGETH